ncbi:hypothetical protein TNCV_4196051 [Trichonephila clavipes]|nr:hypothetical protein TNCV_4196051 [Trichonephila clavipes]
MKKVKAYGAKISRTEIKCGIRIRSPRQYLPQNRSLQHSRTSAFGTTISGNSSGATFLEGPSRDSPFSPEPLQLR